MLKEILENKKDQRIMIEKYNAEAASFKIVMPNEKEITITRRIFENGTLFNIYSNDQQEQKIKCSPKEESIIGAEIITKDEIKLLEQICETILTFNEVTGGENTGFYIKFDAVERIIRENMEAKMFLLQEWALRSDLLKLGEYKGTYLDYSMQVEKKKNKSITIIFKDKTNGYTERYDLMKKGIFVNSSVSIKNKLLVSDTGFLIKEAIMTMYKKQKHEILDIKEIFENDNFYNMELKDLYIFKRTWAEGFHDRTIITEEMKHNGEEKEVLTVEIYEKIKPKKKKIKKEHLESIERLPEKIKIGTNYLFDSDIINQKIYQYEKVLTDLEANLDKMSDEDRKYVKQTLKEDEVEFILCANNFSNEELKIYLNEYLNNVIENMKEIFNGLKTDYEEKMKLLLKIVSKRKSI